MTSLTDRIVLVRRSMGVGKPGKVRERSRGWAWANSRQSGLNLEVRLGAAGGNEY